MMKPMMICMLVLLGSAGLLPKIQWSASGKINTGGELHIVAYPANFISRQTLQSISPGRNMFLQPPLAASMERGKKVYQTYCLPCHQADGSGVPRLNPPLIKTSFVLGDKKLLIGIVLHGLDQEVEIDGEVYSNVMASHDFLKDEEIADVLTYVRNSFGNKAPAVKPAEVAAVRAAKKN
jgi:mono/diheme cytochrome c family protein